MVFRKGLWRELAGTCIAALVVLLAIIFTTQMIRILGRAARGEVAAEAVFAYLGFGVLDHLPILLSLALFIAVLMVLSRAYRESEMVIWFTAGVGLTGFIRPVLTFAAPVLVLITVLSLLLLPWAAERKAHYRKLLEQRSETSMIAPGVFSESRRSDRVFFVESLGGVGTEVRNVFVQSSTGDRMEVIFALHGYQEATPEGHRYLVLLQGRRYEGPGGAADFNTLEFGKYAVRIAQPSADVTEPEVQALSMRELASRGRPYHWSEVFRRCAIPLGAVILALLAIPLSFVNPRAGRSANMGLAVLVYMASNNLAGIGQAWVAQGKLSFAGAMLGVHGFLLAALIGFFYFSVFRGLRSATR